MLKKPIHNRLYLLSLLLIPLVGFPTGLLAEDSPEPLREQEVLKRALGREALENLIQGSVDTAASDVINARSWTNPVLSFTFEQAKGGGGGTSEGIYFLSQQIEPGRRRRLRTRAAEARVDGAKERGAMLRLRMEAQVRETFYELLATQSRADAARAWRTRMARVAQVVELRKRAGDASGYDLQRVAREQATVDAAVSTAEAEGIAKIEKLGGMIGGLPPGKDLWPTVAGDLLSPLPPPDLEELLEKLTDRPDVRALQEEARAAGYEEQVGKRWKIPSFTIGAGFKDVQDGPLDLGGPVAYAAVPLPFLNRQEGAIRKARAKRRQAAGASALLLQEARGEIRGLYGKERQLVLVANRFRSQALDPAQDLLQTAEVAYKAGEVGILSLLDAYRSAYEAQTQYLTLALEARRARIELDRSTGGIQ